MAEATSAAPCAVLAHALPGRLRLRLPALRGDGAGMAALAAALGAVPGVLAIAAAPLTGSLLLRHTGPAEAVLAAAGLAGLLRVVPAAAAPASASALPVAALLPAAGAVASAGLALLQLARREALPPALTLGCYAVELARAALHRAAGQAASTAAKADPPPPG
jgi:hypothetical protein